MMGEAIRAGSEYPPLHLHAARVATRAQGHKNFRGQLEELYKDLQSRWKYVRDIDGLETIPTSGRAIYQMVLGNYAKEDPRETGFGDCDCVSVALGSLARSIGLPVRLVTMAKPGQTQHSHVYPEIMIPGEGWIPADPVAHPLPLGQAPSSAGRMIWDLFGRIIGLSGTDDERCSYKCPEERAIVPVGPQHVPGQPWATPGTVERLKTGLEVVRNKREEFQTAFENFDRKANQTLNILSTVMESMRKTSTSPTRSMLGGVGGDAMACFTNQEIVELKQLLQYIKAQMRAKPGAKKQAPKKGAAKPPRIILPAITVHEQRKPGGWDLAGLFERWL